MFFRPLPLLLAALSVLPAAAGAQPGTLELTSPLGRKLYALPDDVSVIAARKELAARPKEAALVLKLSLAEASRRQYREAVTADTAGIAVNPLDAHLYLERGHRLLGLREFESARRDLQRSAQLDPKLLDAHYHLGLALYFLGRFPEAAASFDRARALAPAAENPDDSLIDCSAWLYAAHRRAGNDQAAAEVLTRITPSIKNTEAHLFFYLQLLHFYQGKLTAEAILPPKPASPSDTEGELSFNTISYGLGNWYLYNGKPAQAIPLFREVVKGEAWNAWGFIGSERELAALKQGSSSALAPK